MRWIQRPSLNLPVGTYKGRFRRRTLALSPEEAKVHVHVLGKSGSGKSRWLAGWFLSLLRSGYAATLIDPHGDLSRLVLAHLVADGYFEQDGAHDRLLFLDVPGAARAGRYLPFDVLRQPYDTYTTTRLVLEALRRMFPSLDGGVAPAFEQIVTAGVHVLREHGLPFSRLRDLLVDKPWRDALLAGVEDGLVTSYFRDEYDRYDPKERMHLQGSTLRRLFLLLYNPVLRHSLGANANLLSYRPLIDGNRSVVVNLALGDPDARRLLGCLLTVSVEQAALSRADQPPGSRFTSHFLLLDEFTNYCASDSRALAAMLSQTRKFDCHLVLAHQQWDQADGHLRSALQNVGLEVTFRTGRDDAERSARLLGQVDPHAIKHQVASAQAQERSHPVYYSPTEQLAVWSQQIAGLEKRSAYVQDPAGRVLQVESPNVPDPAVDPDRLAAVEEYYLRACFAPPTPPAGAPAGPPFQRPALRREE